MPVLVTQIDAAEYQKPKIAAPAALPENGAAGSVPLGTQKILPPSSGSQQDNTFDNPQENFETPTQRRQRLLEAGILEPLPKGKQIKTPTEKLADNLFPDVEKNGLLYAAPEHRFEFSYASWWALYGPKGARFKEDFSVGGAFLFYLPNTASEKKFRLFFGPAALFFNGGVYTTAKGPRGTIDPLYADWNSSELGAQALLKYGDSSGKWFLQDWELNLLYLPVRLLKTFYASRSFPAKNSEARSHSAFNYLGVGVQGAYRWEMARTLGVGPFAGVYFAAPLQLRARLGITISLASFKQEEQKEEAKK